MKFVDAEELEKQGWQLTRTVRAPDPNRMVFETKKLTDCFCIDLESDPAYETCDDCVYSADSDLICQLRGCIHAAPIYGLHECYKKRPKETEE